MLNINFFDKKKNKRLGLYYRKITLQLFKKSI